MIDDLRTLRCFIAVAEELNFRKAAERLHMSQPPLSRLISALEDQVEAPLFLRSTRKVELTRPGVIFLEAAREVLATAAAAGRRIRSEIQSPQRSLRIGCTSAAYFVGLPEMLDHFRSAHPATPLEVTGMDTAAQIDALLSGSLDAGFTLPADTPLPAELDSTLFSSIRMRLAVPRRHPLAKMDGPVPLELFRHETFILHQRAQDPGMYEGILRCCTRAGFRPRVRVKKHHEPCMGLVTSGAGVHFSAATAPCLTHTGVAFLDLHGEAPTLEIHLLWRNGDPSPALKKFLKLAQKPTARPHAKARERGHS